MRHAAALIFLFGVALGAGSGDGEWSEVYRGHLPGVDNGFVTVLVTDGRTGTPIEGARVNRHPENYPTAGGWAPFEIGATTDRFGLASIEVGPDAYSCHFAVYARGYAPFEEYGGNSDFEVRLYPGRTGHGRIVDVFGKPVRGVTVEYKLGCAHAPALRTAVTDREGRFEMREILTEGDLHFSGPSVRAQYSRARALAPLGSPPTIIVALSGLVLSGRILEADPHDLLGATIWSDTSPRGPLAGIASDGSFTLPGADHEARLVVMGAGDSVPAEIDPRAHAPGRPILVRSKDPDDDAACVKLEVAVSTESGTAVPDGVRVHLDRRSDGRRRTVKTVRKESTVFEVTPETWELSAGGPFARYVAASRPVMVVPEMEPVPLVLREQARLELIATPPPTGWPAHSRVILNLCLADRVMRIWNAKVEEPTELEEVWLPNDQPARVRLWMEGVTVSAKIGPSRDGIRRAVIPWPEAPLEEVPDSGPDGVLEIHLPDKLKTGRVHADIFPPDEGGGDWEYATADETGVIRHPALVTGAIVRIDGLLGPEPSLRLEGEGPWSLRPGDATLDVRVVGEGDAEDLDPVLYVDGEMWRATGEGEFHVPSLPAGEHLLIAGGEGHFGRAVRIDLAAAEVRVLELTLERRE